MQPEYDYRQSRRHEAGAAERMVPAIVLISVGAIFLLHNLHIFVAQELFRFWPAILIAVGVAMLFQTDLAAHIGVVKEIRNERWGYSKESAVFSGGKRTIVDQNFTRAKYDAVFGGFEIDLRRANIEGDSAVLDLNAVFGGIEVRVPESWSVVMKGAGVFGGYVDSTTQPDPRIYPNPKHLICKGGAVFGGVEIKN